jgi:hypothetical protein
MSMVRTRAGILYNSTVAFAAPKTCDSILYTLTYSMKRTLASVAFAATVVAVVTLTGPSARATMTEQIDAPGAALTGFTGPYATVPISRVTNNRADIVLTSLTNLNGQRFSKSDSTAADLSVNGAFALGAAAAADVFGSGFSASFGGVNSFGTLDGFGDVSFSLDSGYPDAANLVSFLITSTTGCGPPTPLCSSTMPAVTARRSALLRAPHLAHALQGLWPPGLWGSRFREPGPAWSHSAQRWRGSGSLRPPAPPDDCTRRHLRAEIEAYHVWSDRQWADATGPCGQPRPRFRVFASPCSLPQSRFFLPARRRKFTPFFIAVGS